jgi:hypothetical protein
MKAGTPDDEGESSFRAILQSCHRVSSQGLARAAGGVAMEESAASVASRRRPVLSRRLPASGLRGELPPPPGGAVAGAMRTVCPSRIASGLSIT